MGGSLLRARPSHVAKIPIPLPPLAEQRRIAAILDKAGVRIARSLVGPYITSLDMAGCSVTLLRADDELLRLWDHPINTPALRRGC